ncbi:MAG: hypothetical protein LBK94_02975 [Prevotellaceae bacterium]|jgi:hypothetical protein|nr:hypothetical protein [Prevotellaceae bacterium]
MKKLIFLLSIMAVCFENSAQTNGKGILKKNVFQLNSGITFSKGDTIMLGVPENNADRFTHIYEPRHAFGLLGGNGADKTHCYKMFIIHFFTTKNDKDTKEKTVVASLGYGKEQIILDCEIAEAVETGEVIAKGRVPQKFNIAIKNDAEREKTEEPQRINPEKPAVIETEKVNITENALLNKINELNKNKDINDSDHYQLLKLVTSNSNADIDNKQDIIKTLQSLRDSKKLEIEYYDEIINLFLR